jgi:hypothetical protein
MVYIIPGSRIEHFKNDEVKIILTDCTEKEYE